ncbi:MAG: hypothetical protein IJ733_01220 [Lachnospiraceae bacterium]|nr:hypothetical protein [Lachnospiraceae bacterium]
MSDDESIVPDRPFRCGHRNGEGFRGPFPGKGQGERKVIINEGKDMEIVLNFESELRELEELRKQREAELA